METRTKQCNAVAQTAFCVRLQGVSHSDQKAVWHARLLQDTNKGLLKYEIHWVHI